ncbi:MAG: hypothetical protein QM820_17450 [Minicystis sp.]
MISTKTATTGDSAKHSPVAIFTGAGASAAFGYPLTSQLLPRILERLAAGTLFRKYQPDLDELASALRTLFPGLPIGAGDVSWWITDILSLLDQAIETGTALHPKFGVEQIRRCRALLDRALYEALEVSAPEHPEQVRFHDWLNSLSRNAPIGVISTNYDLTVDQPILNAERSAVETEVDFGFDWRDVADGSIHPRPKQPRVRLFKLHGSLNWLKCNLCEHVYVNPVGKIAYQAFRRTESDANTCHCGYWPLSAHLVAPSLVRDIRDPTLLSIWKTALEFLREAEQWYFVGYSLPSEDVAIRSLLLRALHMRKTLPTVTVVQYGEKAAAAYQLLFPGCTYLKDGLSRFLDLHEAGTI